MSFQRWFHEFWSKDRVLLCLLYAIVNAPFLLHNGFYYDDWYYNLVGPSGYIYHNVIGGRPWFGWAGLPFFPVTDLISGGAFYVHRGVVFLWMLVAALSADEVLKKIPTLDTTSRQLTVLFFTFLPLSWTRIFVAIWPYYCSYALFFIAAVLAIHRKKGPYRLTALACLAISFMTPSLIVYCYLLFFLFLYDERKTLKGVRGWATTILRVVRQHLDFALLPVAAWVLMKIYFPSFGELEYYNKITLERVLVAPGNFIPAIVTTILESIQSSYVYVFKGRAYRYFEGVYIVYLISSILFARSFYKNFRNEKVPPGFGPVWWNASLGFLFFVAAWFPYQAVGRTVPKFTYWDIRDHLLLPLGTAVLLVQCFVLIRVWAKRQKQKVRRFIDGVVAVSVSMLLSMVLLHHFTRWIDFNFDWFKQLALVEKFKQTPEIQKNNFFLVTDEAQELDVILPKYFYEYLGFLNAEGSSEIKFICEKNTLAIRIRDRGETRLQDYVTGNGPDSPFHLRNFIPRQPHEIVIQKGPQSKERGVIRFLQFKYWQHFDRLRFQSELNQLISLKVFESREPWLRQLVPPPRWD